MNTFSNWDEVPLFDSEQADALVGVALVGPLGDLVGLRRRDRAADELHHDGVGVHRRERLPVGVAPLAKVQALCEYWRTGYDWRRCEAMLNGWDETDQIANRFGGQIAAFEAAQRQSQPWLYLEDTLP